MTPINPLDEAELRVEMRQLYLEQGLVGATQALYEILIAAEILSEVILNGEKERSDEKFKQ